MDSDTLERLLHTLFNYRGDFPVMIYFHRSKIKIPTPPAYESYMALPKLPDAHPNDALGIFVSTTDGWIMDYGALCYIVTMKGDTKYLNLPRFKYKEIRNSLNYDNIMLNAKNYFLDKRQEWLDKGIDVVNLMESDNSVKIAIILNFDKIESFRLSED